MNHPKLGASWEGMALESIIALHRAEPEACYFWAIHQGAELDLLIIKDGKRMGFEIKYSLQPKLTKSMQQAQALLKLDSLQVIIPGTARYPLSETVEVIGVESLA